MRPKAYIVAQIEPTHRADAKKVTSERREKESRRKHTNRGTETPGM
jgi:hypothetical protein